MVSRRADKRVVEIIELAHLHISHAGEFESHARQTFLKKLHEPEAEIAEHGGIFAHDAVHTTRRIRFGNSKVMEKVLGVHDEGEKKDTKKPFRWRGGRNAFPEFRLPHCTPCPRRNGDNRNGDAAGET